MACVTIPAQNRSLTDPAEITKYLTSIGIDYERWESDINLELDASSEAILAAYGPQIDVLKKRGGYVTADVIDVNPQTAGLDAMLAKFNIEHTHDEDEVRFIVAGRGIFFVNPPGGPVVSIEVTAGDWIRVPRGTLHWFNLCTERRIRTIRLFQDVSGWTPHYTGSGVDQGFEPVCFGPNYFVPSIDRIKPSFAVDTEQRS
jgi:1,2-dihydroxy-3-keto-5-methylthiopentene dioxygenase